MTVLHTGWTKKFGENYESIFGGKRRSGSGKAKAAKSVTPKKKTARKKSARAKR